MRSGLVALVTVLAFALASSTVTRGDVQAPPGAKYPDPDQPLGERVRDLVSRMTLAEKVGQMQHNAPAIDRLGVPAYNWWNEGLHGVARAGRATVFPQAIGLAATWNVALMHQAATAIADEARAKHHDFARRGQRGIYQGLTFWSPNINIFRDPRWGRGMETYGEDPYLVGRLAVAFVKGMQGDDPKYLKTVATPKHFAVHSGPESDRHVFDAVVDARDLRDTYLPQFEMAIREGGAWSVMCAYNRYLGKPACASPVLLDSILRKEWGFGGYVVSDCGAIDDISATHKVANTPAEASAMSVKAGCDLSCGTTYAALADAVKQGLITEPELDTSLERLFAARFRLGMFDPPDRVRFASTPIGVVDRPDHQVLALDAARQSIVLLKNEGGILPLRKDVRTIAVIGPNADDEGVLFGNYNGTPSRSVTPLEGIRRKVAPTSRVLYAQGTDWADGLPAFEVVPAAALRTLQDGRPVEGLTGEYFNAGPAVTAPKGLSWDSATLTFPDLTGHPVFRRVDTRLDFHWFDASPDARLPEDGFAIRWTGELVPPVSGNYLLGGYGYTGFRLYLDDKLLIEFKSNHEPTKKAKTVALEAGRGYRLRVEYFDRSADARFQLLWTRPDRQLQERALSIAKQADVIVAVLGLCPRLEGEEMEVPVAGFKRGDRLTLDLPAAQQQLLEKLGALGKPVVLVLLNGSALAVNWAAEHVPAIVEAWYPGQAAGTAIADVLFGDHNPGGRLPVTFYKSVEQLPAFSDYRMAGRTYRYFKDEPLYPFGFGLSYTRFSYRNLVVAPSTPSGQDVDVSVEVENAGKTAGDEVVQLYVADLQASVPTPVRSLQGFGRVTLAPGERRTIRFVLTPRQLSVIDDGGQRVVEPGTFELAVGGKQPGFVGRADAATTQVLKVRFEVTGGKKLLPE